MKVGDRVKYKFGTKPKGTVVEIHDDGRCKVEMDAGSKSRCAFSKKYLPVLSITGLPTAFIRLRRKKDGGRRMSLVEMVEDYAKEHEIRNSPLLDEFRKNTERYDEIQRQCTELENLMGNPPSDLLNEWYELVYESEHTFDRDMIIACELGVFDKASKEALEEFKAGNTTPL